MISNGDFPPFAIPRGQIWEFGAEDSRLNSIQATVVPLQVVIILLRLAVVAQHPDTSRDFFIVSGHRAGFSACTQVFSWIETESSGAPHRTSLSPPLLFARKILCAVSLTSVFDHKQVVSFREFQDGIHVRHLAVQMHGNDRCDRASSLPVQ